MASEDKMRTLVDILRRRSDAQGSRTAYTFLADGESQAHSLTYGELDRRAQRIAAFLQETTKPGDRALLLYPQGLEFLYAFFGCLYAAVIPIPAYLPRANRPDPRIASIVADARPSTVLGTAASQARADLQSLRPLRWINTDTLPHHTGRDWRAPSIGSETLAFLQYTSGSTTAPRGVMVSHGNVLHNSAYIDLGCEYSPASVSVTWLPHFHDLGLIEGFLQPLVHGFPCYFMSPVSFLQQPIRWLRAISRYRGTHSGGPNFAFDLCCRKVTEMEARSLDLSSWCVAYNGSEPIRKETLERFFARFKVSGFRWEAFYPCYGLAESTLKVTGGLKGDAPVIVSVDKDALQHNHVHIRDHCASGTVALVGSGRAMMGTTIAIVDPTSLTPCAENAIGEVWVAGPGVAQGYWNRPEATEQTFRASTAEDDSGSFLRTGDLGFLRAGELFLTGRLKDVIILRGRQVYPQDIENTVEHSHPLIRPGGCGAFGVSDDGEEHVVVAAEITHRCNAKGPNAQTPQTHLEELAYSIQQAVAEQHELRTYAVLLLRPGVLPKTSSGKVQRYRCRKLYASGSLDALYQLRPKASAASSRTPRAIT